MLQGQTTQTTRPWIRSKYLPSLSCLCLFDSDRFGSETRLVPSDPKKALTCPLQAAICCLLSFARREAEQRYRFQVIIPCTVSTTLSRWFLPLVVAWTSLTDSPPPPRLTNAYLNHIPSATSHSWQHFQYDDYPRTQGYERAGGHTQ